MIDLGNRFTLDGFAAVAGADLDIGVQIYGSPARNRPFILCLSGCGFEASRNLSVDDLVGIRDWIDRALADHEVAA